MRETLQDQLHAWGFPGRAMHRPPCCLKPMPSFAIVRLTDDEAEEMEACCGRPMIYACGDCLAPAPVIAMPVLNPGDPWGDNEFANGVRAQRFQLLMACDWTQAPDVPIAGPLKEAWRLYRQALRDITETFASPIDPDFAWPTAPGV